jgi:hypothetical protein
MTMEGRVKPRVRWYKVFSGLPQDTKLAVVAKRAGFRRGEVLAVWVALLDHASAADPRGSVKGVDAEEIATALECDAVAVENVIAALREREMILPGGMIPCWDKHQNISTPRTRAYRARVVAAPVPESDASRRQRLQNKMNARRISP